MNRLLTIVVVGMVWLVLETAAACAQEKAAGQPVRVVSPDGRVGIDVSLGAAGGALQYQVSFNGRPVILDSPMRVELGEGDTLGADCAIERVETKALDNTYTQFPGKRSRVTDRCSEAAISIRENRAKARRWQLVVRAYDDGVAFRYRFAAQEGWPSLVVAAERTGFAFPEGSRAYALPLNSFTTSYEKRYAHIAIAEIPGDWLLGLPCVVEVPGVGFAAVTEANLTDYAGMYLAHEGGKGTALTSRLSPLPGAAKVAVRAMLPHDSPWRVVMVGERMGKFLESDLLLNLNEPSAIKDVSWIKPGKTTFPWWNGFYEKDVAFEPGLNTATAKYYIDFCAEAGIPYHSLDGKGNTAWYGGPIVPYQGADITRAVEGLDLPEVLRYAKGKGVRMRFWMHWQAARAHMARAFPLYHQWGVEGVMIDFMDRDDQEMVNFMREILRTAAANHLTVTFHGVCKPTGLERTYPNLLTSEGAMNYEYDKWDKVGIPPEHDLTLVFTRMLAGPMDFHQGSLRGVSVEEFRPRNEAPLVMGTPCRMLATYVVFENHLPMVADYPSAYRGHPALPILAAVPTTWDDARVLEGEVGKRAVIARRHGEDWWIGAMADREGGKVRLPLDWIGAGRFKAEIYRDDLGAKYHLAREEREVEGKDVLEIDLAPAGGMLVRVSPGGR
ncbi:MAG: glycoside hydrolase [Phycisphaerales bacterium]|nr:glycoside hydrolase [Phycisphaerales bacterium]